MDGPPGHHAYLRRGLGDGGPGCGPAGRFRFVVHSDLRGGSRGTIWRRRRALVPFGRDIVTVEADGRGKPSMVRPRLREGEQTQAPARAVYTWVP